jgi:hypothetical protein
MNRREALASLIQFCKFAELEAPPFSVAPP